MSPVFGLWFSLLIIYLIISGKASTIIAAVKAVTKQSLVKIIKTGDKPQKQE